MSAARLFSTLSAVALVAVLVSGAAASGSVAPLTADDLAYEGASVDVQIDVNGEAAIQLLGGVLDAAAEVAEEQIAAMTEGGPAGALGPVGMARPLIGPAKETIKSITQVTALIMKTEQPIEAKDIMSHYSDLAIGRGWTPMVRVAAEKDVNIAAFLAPEAKGIFAVIRPNQRELIVGAVTARAPLGDLLAEVIRAGGGEVIPHFLAARMTHSPPAPEAPASEDSCQGTESADPSVEPPSE
jgi:hypothetical protein